MAEAFLFIFSFILLILYVCQFTCEQDGLIATCRAERDLLTTEKEQLQHVFQEQEK